MKIQTVIKKTLEDFSDPKFLIIFLVPFVVITLLLSAGITAGGPEDLASLPLRTQERQLVESFSQLSFIWLAGIPVMALIAIVSANYIGKEEEDGSLRILLSKPVRRWEVIMGKFLSIFVFSFLVMVTGMFLGSALIFIMSGASASAIGGSIMSIMPGNIAYAIFVSFFVSSLGTGISVVTGSRLKTAISVIILSVILLFSFIIVRMATQAMGLYQSYYIYSVDLNYHLGNSYVFLLRSLTGGLAPPVQSGLSAITGTFDVSGAGVDPLVGGMPTSLPLAGYVSPVVSFAGVVLISVAILAYAVYRFERKDIL